MRVLLTGLSGTGKSTLVQELRRRGFVADDADEDGFSEPRGDGRWGWRREVVARTNNAYGRAGAELDQVLADRAEIEPLLRRSADLAVMCAAPSRAGRRRGPGGHRRAANPLVKANSIEQDRRGLRAA